MASPADIAGIYTFKLFEWEAAANSTGAVIAAAIIWIAVMTWICYRGTALRANPQVLLGAELFILTLFSIVAFVKVYSSHLSNLDQALVLMVQPVRHELSRAGGGGAARDLHLLGLGLRCGG